MVLFVILSVWLAAVAQMPVVKLWQPTHLEQSHCKAMRNDKKPAKKTKLEYHYISDNCSRQQSCIIRKQKQESNGVMSTPTFFTFMVFLIQMNCFPMFREISFMSKGIPTFFTFRFFKNSNDLFSYV